MRRLLVPLLMVALVLAGCTSEGEASGAKDCTASDCAQPSAAPATFDAETGAIAGALLDESLQPVPNGQVGLKETEQTATVDAAGMFTFSNLVPGRYTVLANALGFGSAAKSVEVSAGSVVEVRILLTAQAVATGYTELKTFTGLIECGFGTSAVVGNCIPLQFLFDQLGTNPTSTRTVGKYDVTDPTLVQSGVFEMTWTPSSAGGGQQLGLYVDEDGAGPTSGENYASENGAPPVRIQVDAEPYEKIQPTKKVQTRTFMPGTTPPGYVLNQKFEIFGTHCYVVACAEDYTALSDG